SSPSLSVSYPPVTGRSKRYSTFKNWLTWPARSTMRSTMRLSSSCRMSSRETSGDGVSWAGLFMSAAARPERGNRRRDAHTHQYPPPPPTHPAGEPPEDPGRRKARLEPAGSTIAPGYATNSNQHQYDQVTKCGCRICATKQH